MAIVIKFSLIYLVPNAEAGTNRESYPLRPELIESVMYLYRATGDPYLLEVGEDMLRSIQSSARTSCGYATVTNRKNHQQNVPISCVILFCFVD